MIEVTPTESDIIALKDATRSMGEIVLTVLNGSHNFVSTLDHLPCDIVRSLWLIQSLQLRIFKYKAKLLIEFKSNNLNQIKYFRSLIDRNLDEIKVECQYLVNLLKSHLSILNDDQTVNELLVDKLKSWTSEEVERQWKDWCIFKAKITKKYGKGDKEKTNLKIKINLKSANIKLTKNTKDKTGKQQLQTEAQTPEQSVSAEPTYCICNGIASGKMVACENPDCEREWFHFKCMNIVREPAKEWFCSKGCEIHFKRKLKRRKRS